MGPKWPKWAPKGPKVKPLWANKSKKELKRAKEAPKTEADARSKKEHRITNLIYVHKAYCDRPKHEDVNPGRVN